MRLGSTLPFISQDGQDQMGRLGMFPIGPRHVQGPRDEYRAPESQGPLQ